VSTALGSTPAIYVHVFTSSPVDYHTEVHDFGRQHKCDDTMFKFREGTRHSGVRGLEKQILVRIFYISGHIAYSWLDMPQFRYGNKRQCSRGDWALRWRVLRAKGEISSHAFYTLLRGII